VLQQHLQPCGAHALTPYRWLQVVAEHIWETSPAPAYHATIASWRQTCRAFKWLWVFAEPPRVLTLRGDRPLEGLPNSLDITSAVVDRQALLRRALVYLSACSKLTSLSIRAGDPPFDGHHLLAYSSFSGLTSFSLELDRPPSRSTLGPTLQVLGACSNLRSLRLVARDSWMEYLSGEGNITALTQLTQLVLAGPWPLLRPTLLRHLTALGALANLTLHWYVTQEQEQASQAAFASLSSLPHLTGLHLLHGGPWDPTSKAQDYLSHSRFFLAGALRAFTQLVELSVFLAYEEVHFVASLTNLKKLRLAVYVPHALEEQPIPQLEAALGHLSALRQLQTLHVAPVRFKLDADNRPYDHRTWGLRCLPATLAQLQAVRNVGLLGARTPVLPNIFNRVRELDMSDCSISLAAEDLARRSQLTTLKAWRVTGILITPQDPAPDPAPAPPPKRGNKHQRGPTPAPPSALTSCLTVLRLAGSVEGVEEHGLLAPPGR
jgi:hypothetical protein